MEAPLGNLEDDSFNGDLRGSNSAFGKQSISLFGSSVIGTWRDGSLLETMKARSSQYSEKGSNTDFRP